ncbi:nitroreductase/quinone reductase family protein [Micromonospora halophytica]|uniref:Deazaflavin-dependent oxidoreductase, nitroreductase family n=1 Tax=Micromonospora halophytica TaxID=47864 RepID=A0A1C5JB00_9ACTN|nr:nitroreductase/quinone reductase family protein [Micromonospora halophytica]SCG67683.1 deazaflavin-dependent oxidoreductase, nitroreductase family [Micromonospora halophytica]
MPNDVNTRVIEEFRANAGRVDGWSDGARLLLLTTTGARTGAPHTTPLGYLPDGDRVLVIASAGGAPRDPQWFRNLLADPMVTVEDGVFTYRARAEVLDAADRDRAFARAAEAHPGWAEYQDRAGRQLPVVALEQVPGPPISPTGPPGAALVAVHDAFRRELALIRDEVERSGARIGAQLRVNCLTLCQGLHGHHEQEDTGLFPWLADNHPELAPVMQRIEVEHRTMAALLQQLRTVLSAPNPDREVLRREVARLTDQVLAHLAYEEEQLAPFLGMPA